MLSGEKQILAGKQKATIIRESRPANPFTRVDTVIVRVPDLDKAKRWYEEKLGFEASFIGKNEIVVFKQAVRRALQSTR